MPIFFFANFLVSTFSHILRGKKVLKDSVNSVKKCTYLLTYNITFFLLFLLCLPVCQLPPNQYWHH